MLIFELNIAKKHNHPGAFTAMVIIYGTVLQFSASFQCFYNSEIIMLIAAAIIFVVINPFLLQEAENSSLLLFLIPDFRKNIILPQYRTIL